MNNSVPEVKNKFIKCKKVKFNDENSASFTLKKIHQNTTLDKKPIRAYECKICGCWHLTSKPDVFAVESENKMLVEENKILKQQIEGLQKNENYQIKLDARKDSLVKQLKQQFSMMAGEMKKIRAEKSRIQNELISLKLSLEKPQISEKSCTDDTSCNS